MSSNDNWTSYEVLVYIESRNKKDREIMDTKLIEENIQKLNNVKEQQQ